MIDLPNDIKLKYDADLVMFRNQIEDLKRKAIAAKSLLLTEQFEPFHDSENIDDRINYVLQFIDYIIDLVLFPDEEVFIKLKEMKFAKHSLKWFVNLEDILVEIERLNNIEGLFLLPNTYLFAVNSHLQVKLFVSIIEGFGLHAFYNNSDTNIIYKDFSERYRRKEYNEKKGQTPKMDWFERTMYNMLYRLEEKCNHDKAFVKKMMLQSSKGSTLLNITLFQLFYNKGISRDRVYYELFPLLKIIMKDYEFLSEEKFISSGKDNKYEANYSRYKIARTKKILQKK